MRDRLAHVRHRQRLSHRRFEQAEHEGVGHEAALLLDADFSDGWGRGLGGQDSAIQKAQCKMQTQNGTPRRGWRRDVLPFAFCLTRHQKTCLTRTSSA
jgi:hypothetical protein